jgi:hypothetical protein
MLVNRENDEGTYVFNLWETTNTAVRGQQKVKHDLYSLKNGNSSNNWHNLEKLQE